MSNIRVELQLADGSFTSGMLRAGQSLNEFNQQLIRTNPRLAALASGSGSIVTSISRAEVATKGFLGTLRDVSIVTGLVSMGISSMSSVANGFVGQIVKVNAEMERLRFMMQAMSTAKDPLADANRSVAYLREQAKNMPFAMGTITNAFVKLKTTGMDPMNGSLRALADGIAAFGGDDQAFNRVVMGITQMSGKSVIQMEEMRQQLGESMPAAMQVMARSMGVSIAELTKAIGTGRVAAQPALEGFFEELKRSYGGEAQRMMQTFSGQVSQLATNLQNLATNEGGSGFFDQVKEQLLDINQFLQSDAAQVFATRLGQGLSQAIGWIRSAVNAVFEFRTEILNVGTAVAMAFGGLAIVRGLSSFVGAIGTLRAAFVGISAQMMVAGNAQAYYNLVTNSGAPALVRLRAAMMVTTATAGALTATLSAVAPWVAAIGLAVYAAGNYFGWFTDKVRENYEGLQKYGAETRKQAADIINARKKQLEAEKTYFERMANYERERNGGVVPQDILDGLKDAEERIAKLDADAKELLQDASGREDQAALAKLDRRLQTEVGMVQNRYREEQANAERHFDELAKKDAESGKVAVKTEEDRKARILEIQRARSKAILDIYQKEEDELKRRQQGALGDELSRINTLLGNVRAMWLQENENLRNLKSPDGVQFTNKPVNDDENIKAGQNALKGLMEDIVKAQATLGGASGAAAEMWQKIKSGDYGQIEGATEETRKLHDELLAATNQKEMLDKLLKGEKKAEQDLASLRQNILAKEFELRKKMRGDGDMNESEEFLLKLDEGFYPGLGPIEKVREAVAGVVGMLNLQGDALNSVGQVMRENTFGDQSGQHIDTITTKLRTLHGVLGDISSGIAGIDFSGMGAGLQNGFTGMAGAGQSFRQFSGSILELIAKGESGGDYNATLDHGRWTGGSKNLVGMTLNQVRDLQRQMLANPENRAKYHDENGNAVGSSALGKYQIVGKTLENLMRTMGLSGDELFDAQMQDRMAMQLLNGRQGQGLAGLRKEWTSLKNVPDDVILKALSGASNGPTVEKAAGFNPSALTQMPQLPQLPAIATYDAVGKEEALTAAIENRSAAYQRLRAEGEELRKREAAADEGLDEVKRNEALDKILEKTKAVSSETEKLGQNERTWVNAITSGQLGKNRNVDAPEYAKILQSARELDAIEQKMAETKKSSTAADRDRERLDEQRLEINRQIAEQQKLAANPDYKPESSQLRNLRSQLEGYVENVKAAYGEDTQAYRDALAYKSAALQGQTQLDLVTQRAAMNATTRETQTSLLSQTQQRQVMMQRELAELDRRMQLEIQNAEQTGASTLQITEDYEAAKAAVRAKYAQEASPLSKQMSEWTDLQSQLSQASTKWMDSLAGGLTDLIMGTGDLKSVINGILKDVVNMGIKWLMGSMSQGKQGGAGKGAKSGAGKAMAGKSKGVMHTGGIVGSGVGTHKMASSLSFMNAPKFHTGGIVGSKLLPSEVPIIARKGEGVFTPEQMSAMGGMQQSQQFQINAPITVNGSSGTPEQNADLAQKMAREMEGTMRGLVADEFRKQTRPGNSLNSRSR